MFFYPSQTVESPQQVLPRNSTLAAMRALQAFSRKVFTFSSLEGVTDSKQSWILKEKPSEIPPELNDCLSQDVIFKAWGSDRHELLNLVHLSIRSSCIHDVYWETLITSNQLQKLNKSPPPNLIFLKVLQDCPSPMSSHPHPHPALRARPSPARAPSLEILASPRQARQHKPQAMISRKPPKG